MRDGEIFGLKEKVGVKNPVRQGGLVNGEIYGNKGVGCKIFREG